MTKLGIKMIERKMKMSSFQKVCKTVFKIYPSSAQTLSSVACRPAVISSNIPYIYPIIDEKATQ
jgi:hypothetical protein